MKQVTPELMQETAAKVKNWGKWGPDDEVGTVNYVQPEDVVAAARLVRKGRVFSLGMNFDGKGPQNGSNGRINPLHFMTATGTDAMTGAQHRYSGASSKYGMCYADDFVVMPVQCATHWDALGHVFYRDPESGEYVMYNGHSADHVNAGAGCSKSGIEKFRDKMAGRGVLLDMARYFKKDFMLPGEGITCEDLDRCAKEQGVEVRRGDFVLIRTGDLDRRIRENDWGTFCGFGGAPGVEFETINWFCRKEIAAVGMDTWGCEVTPNRSDDFTQPWHWVCIPIAGLTMGEMFRLDELANDCAADKVYDFFFAAPPLAITSATGSPLNPYAIK